MNKEEIVENQKHIEKENEANINETIDCMSLHINGQMTKEYLNFIKEIRKLKKKINKKKTKLDENGILEEAYLKKGGTIKVYFKEMAADYKKSTQRNFRICSFTPNSRVNWFDETFIKLYELMECIDISSKERKYVDQILYKQEPFSSGSGLIWKTPEIEIKAREEIIQKHYDSTTTYIMGQVLCYYYSELDFWKDCLKQLEKLEDIREFE